MLLSFSALIACSVASNVCSTEIASTPAPIPSVSEWKIYKSDETTYNSCVARNNSHPGITLHDSKLVIRLKETKDLKTYQVSVNEQSLAPMSHTNLVDTTCNCLRIRNLNSLNTQLAVIHIQGEDTKNKPVQASITLKNIPAVLQAFKEPVCSRQISQYIP